jgi:hypothetical protein
VTFACKVLQLITSNKTAAGRRPTVKGLVQRSGRLDGGVCTLDRLGSSAQQRRKSSRLYAEFSTGKMSFMRAGEVIRQWIDTGAVLRPQPPADSGVAMTMTAFPLRLSTFLPALDAPVPPEVAVAAPVARVRSSFADRRKLLGKGSVH